MHARESVRAKKHEKNTLAAKLHGLLFAFDGVENARFCYSCSCCMHLLVEKVDSTLSESKNDEKKPASKRVVIRLITSMCECDQCNRFESTD